MNKKAYTLSEVLIALGIVGVLAAIMLPLISKARPDANKVLYLKSYDSLVQTVSEIASSSRLYSPRRTVNGVDYNLAKYPFLDYSQTSAAIGNANHYGGVAKLCNLIRESFGANEINACGTQGGIAAYNFETQNGVRWKIEPMNANDPLTNIVNNSVTFFNTVTIDVNGDKAPNAVYDPSQPNVRPDQFVFYITANAKVIPADVYGQMYIDRRRYWFRKQEDLAGYNYINTNDIPVDIDIPVSVLTGEDVQQGDEQSDSDSSSASNSDSNSDSNSASNSDSNSASNSDSNSASNSDSNSASNSDSNSASISESNSFSESESNSVSNSNSNSYSEISDMQSNNETSLNPGGSFSEGVESEYGLSEFISEYNNNQSDYWGESDYVEPGDPIENGGSFPDIVVTPNGIEYPEELKENFENNDERSDDPAVTGRT